MRPILKDEMMIKKSHRHNFVQRNYSSISLDQLLYMIVGYGDKGWKVDFQLPLLHVIHAFLNFKIHEKYFDTN